MKIIFQTLFILMLSVSCSVQNSPESSDIQIINCNDSITSWEESSAYSFRDVQDSSLFYMKYMFPDSIEAYASYRNKELKAIGKKSNGTFIMLMECFPNGQAKGIVKFNKKGVIHGSANYYYVDGRIRTTGFWENGKKVNEWKEFEKNGRLIKTTNYVK